MAVYPFGHKEIQGKYTLKYICKMCKGTFYYVEKDITSLMRYKNADYIVCPHFDILVFSHSMA